MDNNHEIYFEFMSVYMSQWEYVGYEELERRRLSHKSLTIEEQKADVQLFRNHVIDLLDKFIKERIIIR